MKENADEEWYLVAYAYGNGPRLLKEKLATGKGYIYTITMMM